jgi:hypothetical protein
MGFSKDCFSNGNQLGFHMRCHLFLHYGGFLQNLGKDFIQTNMHTTVHLSKLFVFCSPYLKIEKNRFSLGNNRFWRFVVFEEKITGFTFVTAFRYFPIIFQTRIAGNRKIIAFRTSPLKFLYCKFLIFSMVL